MKTCCFFGETQTPSTAGTVRNPRSGVYATLPLRPTAGPTRRDCERRTHELGTDWVGWAQGFVNGLCGLVGWAIWGLFWVGLGLIWGLFWGRLEVVKGVAVTAHVGTWHLSCMDLYYTFGSRRPSQQAEKTECAPLLVGWSNLNGGYQGHLSIRSQVISRSLSQPELTTSCGLAKVPYRRTLRRLTSKASRDGGTVRYEYSIIRQYCNGSWSNEHLAIKPWDDGWRSGRR